MTILINATLEKVPLLLWCNLQCDPYRICKSHWKSHHSSVNWAWISYTVYWFYVFPPFTIPFTSLVNHMVLFLTCFQVFWKHIKDAACRGLMCFYENTWSNRAHLKLCGEKKKKHTNCIAPKLQRTGVNTALGLVHTNELQEQAHWHTVPQFILRLYADTCPACRFPLLLCLHLTRATWGQPIDVDAAAAHQKSLCAQIHAPAPTCMWHAAVFVQPLHLLLPQ